MTYASRFFLYAPLAVVVILAAVVGLAWQREASALSARLEAINGHDAMPGVTVSFPFNLDAELTNFSVAVATPQGPTRWRSEKFALHALTYGRHETIFEAAGKQQLEWAGGHHLDFAVGALRASAIDVAGALDRFDLDLVGLGSNAFTAQRLQLHLRRDGPNADLFLTADGLTHCAVPALRITATISHADAATGLTTGSQSWWNAVAAWRAAGGTSGPGGKTKIAAEHVLNATDLAAALCR